MKVQLKLVHYIVLAAILTSCSNVRLNFDGQIRSDLQHTKYLNYYFWGLTSTENVIKNSDLCQKSELVELRYRSDFYSVAANYLTIGIWSPKKIQYQCKSDEVKYVTQ